MNAHADPDLARTSACVLFTPEQVRTIAVAALNRCGDTQMWTIDEIEDADPDEIRKRSIVGTLLAPIATALRARGMMVDYTYGSVEDALGLNRKIMHVIFCSCGHGPRMSCGWVAGVLEGAVILEQDGNQLTRAFSQGLH